VVDFLQLPHWPIFNLADMSIDTGAVLIALLTLRGIGIDGSRVKARESTDQNG
jgi:signal peptidase II